MGGNHKTLEQDQEQRDDDSISHYFLTTIYIHTFIKISPILRKSIIFKKKNSMLI
jgi:hypothetical protein